MYTLVDTLYQLIVQRHNIMHLLTTFFFNRNIFIIKKLKQDIQRKWTRDPQNTKIDKPRGEKQKKKEKNPEKANSRLQQPSNQSKLKRCYNL